MIAVISCGSWLSELSATALCSDLQRYYIHVVVDVTSCGGTLGLLAEIVGGKITAKYRSGIRASLLSPSIQNISAELGITSHPLSFINSSNRLGISIPYLHI